MTDKIDQTLTPAERQSILRRLKHGPLLTRAALAEYATRLRLETLAQRVPSRKQAQQ